MKKLGFVLLSSALLLTKLVLLGLKNQRIQPIRLR